MRAPTSTPLAQRLSGSALFSGIGEAWLDKFAKETVARRYAAGEHVWFAGGSAHHFVVIEAGIVEIQNMTPGGDGVVIGLFGAGESVGTSAALERGAYPADALALTETDLLRVRAEPVLEALMEHAPLALAVNRALLAHTAALRAKIDIVSAGSVPRRLAALTLYLIERFGKPTTQGSTAIEVSLTREQIAQLVSARVETVIRIMSRWQKAGWLVTTRHGLEVTRVDMLKRILGA